MNIRYRRVEAHPPRNEVNDTRGVQRSTTTITTSSTISIPVLSPRLTPIPSPPPSHSTGSRVAQRIEKAKQGFRYLSSPAPPVLPTSPSPPPFLRPPPPPCDSASLSFSPAVQVDPSFHPVSGAPITLTMPNSAPTTRSPYSHSNNHYHIETDTMRLEVGQNASIRDGKAVELLLFAYELLYQGYLYVFQLSLNTWLIFFGFLLVFFSHHFLTLLMLMDAVRVMYWDVIKMWLLKWEEETAVKKDKDHVEEEMGRKNTKVTRMEVAQLTPHLGNNATNKDHQEERLVLPRAVHPGRSPIIPRASQSSGLEPEGKKGGMRSSLWNRKQYPSYSHHHDKTAAGTGAEDLFFPSSLPSSDLPYLGVHVLNIPRSQDGGRRRASSHSPLLSSSSSLQAMPLKSIPFIRLALMGSMTAATTLRWKWSQCFSMAASFSEFLEASYPIRQAFPSLFSTPFIANQALLGMALDHSYFILALGLSLWLLPTLCLVYTIMTGARWLVHGVLRCIARHRLLAEDLSSPLLHVLGEPDDDDDKGECLHSPGSSTSTSSSFVSGTEETNGGEERKEKGVQPFGEVKVNASPRRTHRPHSSSNDDADDVHNISSTSRTTSSLNRFHLFPLRSFFSPVKREEVNSSAETEGERTSQQCDGAMQIVKETGRRRENHMESKREKDVELDEKDRYPRAQRAESRRRAQSKKSSSTCCYSARPFINVVESTPSMAFASTAATNLLLNAMKREKNGSGVLPSSTNMAEGKNRSQEVIKEKEQIGHDGWSGAQEGVSSLLGSAGAGTTSAPSYVQLLYHFFFPSSSSEGKGNFHGDPDEACRMVVQLLVVMVTLFGCIWQCTHTGSGIPWLLCPLIYPLKIINGLVLAAT